MVTILIAAFGAAYGTVPTSAAASMAVTSAAYGDYSQMSAASQGAMAAAAAGAQPRLDTPAATDYSAYGKDTLNAVFLSFFMKTKIHRKYSCLFLQLLTYCFHAVSFLQGNRKY